MKNLYIFSLNKKNALISMFLILIFTGIIVLTFVKKTEYVSGPTFSYNVVIDAGHGGIDGGSIGTSTGVVESKLNLEYAKTLSKFLNQIGVGVVMTRTNADGLYDPSASNLKRSDMKKRKEIIDNSGANIVVSIHMNSFSLKSCKGAQVFYKKGNIKGEMLANDIQNQFKSNLENAKSSASIGDYYITNCTDIPAVIVECGFISNAEEEKLLQTKEYRERVCYSILCGIMAFFEGI